MNLLIPSKKLLQKFFLSRPYSVLRGLYIFIPLFSYLLSFFLQMLVILGVWPNLDVYHSMCRGYVGRLIIMFIGSLPVNILFKRAANCVCYQIAIEDCFILFLLFSCWIFWVRLFFCLCVFVCFVFVFSFNSKLQPAKKQKKFLLQKRPLRGLGSLTYPRSFLLILPLLS